MKSNKSPLLLFVIIITLFACGKDAPISTTEIPTTPSSDGPFAIDIGNSEIPYITITTNGRDLENEPKIPADLTVYINKEEVQSQTIGIEYRGSTSYRISDKKSFGIETWDVDGNDIDVSFFDFPAEEDWALIGHVVNMENDFAFDRTLLYHRFAYELFRNMGRYGSRSKLVELELNGEYLGVYVFLEKLKRDKERIDIKKLEPTDTNPEDITGGYILKIDKTSGGDRNLENFPLSYFDNNWDDDARYTPAISFRSEYNINGDTLDFSPYRQPYHSLQYLETYFLYEYPKPDIITAAQKAYIQQYIFDFETALLTDDFTTNSRTYTDYIDLNSFVDFFLVNEVCKNIDGYRLSTYLYKDRGGKLAMGPVWDFNIGYDSSDRIPDNDWVINYNQYVEQDPWMMPFWWPRLLEDSQFKMAIKDRWQTLRGSMMQTSTLLRMVDQDVTYLTDNGAIARNQQKWMIGNHTNAVANLKSYLERRTAWMDQVIGGW